MHCSAEQGSAMVEKCRAMLPWDAAVHHLHRLGVCSSLPRAAPLPPSLPPCRTGPGSHSASQGATKCLAQSPQIFKSLAIGNWQTSDAGVTSGEGLRPTADT